MKKRMRRPSKIALNEIEQSDSKTFKSSFCQRADSHTPSDMTGLHPAPSVQIIMLPAIRRKRQLRVLPVPMIQLLA
jgi:hypothetical protein